jgi:hypothetical protein
MRRNGIEGTHTATTTRENNRARADLNQKPHRVITAITTSRRESRYPEVSTFTTTGSMTTAHVYQTSRSSKSFAPIGK